MYTGLAPTRSAISAEKEYIITDAISVVDNNNIDTFFL